MRKIGCLVAATVWLFSMASAQTESYYDDSFARMSYVSGDTAVQRAQELGTEAGTVNLAVVAGDRLITREGRMEIHFGDRNYLRLDRQTRVDVMELPVSSRDSIKLALLSGDVFLRISFLDQDQEIELHTPDASFYVLEAGLYRISAVENRETALEVIEGSMEAAGESVSEVVRTRERLVAAGGGFIFGPAPLSSLSPDAFSNWNLGRDELLSRAVSQSYLPEEMGAYEAELDYYGHWTYEQPYGYVWIPHVHHDTWRPYYYGRWVWYPIIGYTWVSYEPWGWCVSHYGRWQWRFGLGWYWIPRLGWGPAWVHWYHGSSHYGWCPLSYHGYPGVIVNNHYYGRTHFRDYPLDSRTMVVVTKHQLQNPNVSRVALSRSQLRGLGRVQLTGRQPAALSPAGDSVRGSGRTSLTDRSPIRTYGRSSGSRISAGSSPARRSFGSDRGPDTTTRGDPTRLRSYPSRSARGGSPSASTPGAGSPAGRIGGSGRIPETSRSSRSNGVLRTYPSRSPATGRGTSMNRSVAARSPSRDGAVRTSPGRISPGADAGRSSARSGIVRYPSRSSAARNPSRADGSRTSSVVRGVPSRGSGYGSRSSVSRAPSSRGSRSSASRTMTPRSSSTVRSTGRSAVIGRSSSRITGTRSPAATRSVPSRSSRSSVSRAPASRSSRPSASRATTARRSSVGRSTGRSSARSTAGRSSGSRSSGSRVRKK
jgi:hypothetical protein